MRALRIHSCPELPDETVRRRGTMHLTMGVVLLTIAVWGLWHDWRWVAQPFYAWIWWGYIFLLDGFCARKRGDSLLTRRLNFLIPICIWSVSFWFFFELINVRIQNWYYVGVYPRQMNVAGSLFTMLAFATVFMGIFQTQDALSAAGLWKNWKGWKRSYPIWLSYVLQVIGLVMAGAALIFPYYLAPLVWGSFTLIVDPWNYRRGTRSLLRDLENGDFGLLVRLLLAGLICGVVWESSNFFAPQKWIYTVRGLEEFKLFEMPLLGFLGFPALALDTMAGFALLASIFLGNRTWERAEDLSYEPGLTKPPDAKWFWASVPVHALFWAAVAWYGTPFNVGSVQLELKHLKLTAAEVRELNETGISRPRQLLRRTDSREERQALREKLGWSREYFGEIRNRARLYTFKGIGRHHGRLLEKVGVKKPEDLRAWKPEELYRELMALPGEPVLTLREDFVRVWILAAPSPEKNIHDHPDNHGKTDRGLRDQPGGGAEQGAPGGG